MVWRSETTAHGAIDRIGRRVREPRVIFFATLGADVASEYRVPWGVHGSEASNREQRHVGIFDKAKEAAENLKERAEDLAGEHGDKVVDGVDKATDAVDDKTGGKYTEHLDKADDMTGKAVDALDGDEAT